MYTVPYSCRFAIVISSLHVSVSLSTGYVLNENTISYDGTKGLCPKQAKSWPFPVHY